MFAQHTHFGAFKDSDSVLCQLSSLVLVRGCLLHSSFVTLHSFAKEGRMICEAGRRRPFGKPPKQLVYVAFSSLLLFHARISSPPAAECATDTRGCDESYWSPRVFR